MITLEIKKIVLVFFALCISLTNTGTASELTHKFGNPAFSKEGYSQHALSIEQLQYTRENDRIKDEKSAISQAEKIGRAHVRTPVTEKSRMPSSA